MKKILMLGGSDLQVSIIKLAKDLGHYVITCDYLPNNPGHKYSDEYYNVSTTDKEAVLDLAKKLKIDGVLSYASDPSAPTAAYVSEKLNLPGNSLDAVNTLARKDLFREFQLKNNFETPVFAVFDVKQSKEAQSFLNKYSNKSFLIKPVDSSGSKGVFFIKDNKISEKMFDESLSFSRVSKVIIEEFVEKKGFQLGGDGFLVDGVLVFRCFGDIHFSKTNKFLPCSVSVPTTRKYSIVEKVHQEIQRMISLSGMKSGGLNFDVVVDLHENIYILEIGPRNGGNLLPELINYSTNVDMRIYAIKACLGEDCSDLKMQTENKYFAHYVIHSLKDGIFESIEFSDYLKQFVIYSHLNISKGDEVKTFINSSNRLGMFLLKFNEKSVMHDIIYNMHNYLTINYG